MHTIKKEKATTHHKNKDMTLSSYVVLKGFSHATTDALKKKTGREWTNICSSYTEEKIRLLSNTRKIVVVPCRGGVY